MIRGAFLVMAGGLFLAGPAFACGDKCQAIGEPERRCDVVCNTHLDECKAPSFNSCDQCGTSGAGADGWCTICVPDGANPKVVEGTIGRDLVCLGRGDRIVDVKGGDNRVKPANVVGAYPATALVLENFDWPLGNLVVRAQGGDDTIVGGRGDDIIDAGAGNDTVIGCGGRNALKGGRGNDTLMGGAAFVCLAGDDTVGSLYCGGEGNDVIVGSGPSHQCMDGGAGQAPPSGTQDCTYAFYAGGRSQTSFDLGTARNCASSNVPINDEPCGCD